MLASVSSLLFPPRWEVCLLSYHVSNSTNLSQKPHSGVRSSVDQTSLRESCE